MLGGYASKETHESGSNHGLHNWLLVSVTFVSSGGGPAFPIGSRMLGFLIWCIENMVKCRCPNSASKSGHEKGRSTPPTNQAHILLASTIPKHNTGAPTA